MKELKRDEVIATIKRNLEKRSGKKWSVTGGRGTAWGWLTIDAPPSRRTWFSIPKNTGNVEPGREEYTEVSLPGKEFGHIGPDDRAELAKLLGLDTIHHQGVSIPSGGDYWREYLERSEGKEPTKRGEPYWD